MTEDVLALSVGRAHPRSMAKTWKSKVNDTFFKKAFIKAMRAVTARKRTSYGRPR